MKFAVCKDSFITNIIIAEHQQKEELETALNAVLIDTTHCNVSIGDFWNGENWTRNIDGEQIIIDTNPKVEPTQLDIIEAQVTYTAMMTDTLLEV